MEGEQFSLCWNNFHSNLSSGFNSLLKDEDLVDVTLAADGRFMKAHKTVLSVCSPFFKELFRANPSKHPIVILPDVNYNALCNLLQFMYQGEVSVSQEEIPTFMRVAEMLKVKGLTDNSSSPSSSSESNGYGAVTRSSYNLMEQRQMIKRPRPVKKVIKPVQPHIPMDSPKPKSPQPPAKKPHIEECSSRSEEQEFPEALIKPKEEPLDDSESNTSQKFDENNLDLSAMLDTKLGESSQWQPDLNKPQDSSTPEEAEAPVANQLPEKSRQLYEKEYDAFCRWRSEKALEGVSEEMLLEYLNGKSRHTKISSMWSYYSMLKATLRVKEDVDIAKYSQVTAFLKKLSTGYKPRNLKTFNRNDFDRFLVEASDEKFLLVKVAMIMGVAGGCRMDELHSMTVDDIEDRDSVIVVKVPDSKTHKERLFTIVADGNGFNPLEIVRKYAALRPPKMHHKQFFINYRQQKCTTQPVGKNTLGKMPMVIAKFLKLPNEKLYTGHCFRRSSASFLSK